MPHSDAEYPTLPFASAAAWEAWLVENHAEKPGVWLRIAKKASGRATVTYDEAVDAALCFGWIDGQRKGDGEEFFVQKFTPRRPKSLWSKRNVVKVAQLVEEARMRPGGLAEVEAAQRDGRWDAAYDSPKDMAVPEDFLLAVKADPQALATFDALNRAHRYSIAFRLHNARTEATRARRFGVLLQMLVRGEKPRA